MEYVVGAVLALAVAGLAIAAGFDRDRSFAPTVLVVVATYYVLFAAMGASPRTVVVESAAALGFIVLGLLGFATTPWIVVAAIAGHGVFDLVHGELIADPGVPRWWPGFCSAFDVALGAALAIRLASRGYPLRPPR